jgi:hypothetical protein
MKIVTLQIEDSINQQIMNFLSTFPQTELKIIPQEISFEKTKKLNFIL